MCAYHWHSYLPFNTLLLHFLFLGGMHAQERMEVIMKAPCSTVCKKDMICKIADYCPHWREYVLKLKEERRRQENNNGK